MDKEINGLIYEISDNEVIITDATDDREEYDIPSIIEGLIVAKMVKRLLNITISNYVDCYTRK